MASYQAYFHRRPRDARQLLHSRRRGAGGVDILFTAGHDDSYATASLFWIIGMVFLISSSLLGAVNFIATIIQLRAPGMTWMRLPWFVWAQFVTAFILLLAFPPLEAAAVMQLMDNVAHTSFFLPTGLAVGGQLANVSGGGSPLLWQHSVLVPRPSGGLRFDSAGHGHRL